MVFRIVVSLLTSGEYQHSYDCIAAQITSDLTLGQVKQRVEAEQSIQIAWILLDDVHQSEDTIIADLSMESTGNKLELLSRSK